MSKAAIVVLSSLFLSFVFASSAMAGNFGWGVTGPSEVMQGHSINLTLNVTATGSLNVDHPDPVFTVNTSYIIGDGSSSSTDLSLFTRTPQFNPHGKRNPDAVSGTDSATLTLSAPTGLTPGVYTVTITPSVTQGMTLDPISLPYQVTVKQAALKPIVTIRTPESGTEWLYDTTIDISVSVNDQGSPIFDNSVVASLAGGNPIFLDLDPESNAWEGYLENLGLGSHTLTVSATNAAGTGTATSIFTVYVNFGAWLPPISLGKVQKGGSTLPVKFTLLGALGPVAVAYPRVLMDGVVLGEASVNYDSSGVPFYQLDAKVPSIVGSHKVSVEELDMAPASKGKDITVK